MAKKIKVDKKTKRLMLRFGDFVLGFTNYDGGLDEPIETIYEKFVNPVKPKPEKVETISYEEAAKRGIIAEN